MNQKYSKDQIKKAQELYKEGFGRRKLAKLMNITFGSAGHLIDTYCQGLEKRPLKILCLDIETKPLVSYSWGIWDQNIGLNQIIEDWSILSWAAKWVGEDKIFYQDVSKQKDKTDDSKILKPLWQLMDEADVILGQNHRAFDLKKINTRFIKHKLPPPSSYRTIDTKTLASSKFAFTSNKLEHLTKELCTEKKSSHQEFPGFALWKECLSGNKKAWKQMKDYNIQDVRSTEELWTKLAPWDTTINFGERVCSCGSRSFKEHNKPSKTNTNSFTRLICNKCGREHKV